MTASPHDGRVSMTAGPVEVAAGADAMLLVLLGLRLVGFGPEEAVSGLVALPRRTVRAVLAEAAERGWAGLRQGRAVGWSLLPAGRAEGERLLARQVDEHQVRPVLVTAYERFLGHNTEVLETCTAWQVRQGKTLNDHLDSAYDAAVIARLGTLHEAVLPVCSTLAGALDRFATYEPRLGHALERVQRGERQFFAGAGVPSYHGVWFELHENLLATLGLDRSRELDRRPPPIRPPGERPSPEPQSRVGDQPADPSHPAPP